MRPHSRGAATLRHARRAHLDCCSEGGWREWRARSSLWLRCFCDATCSYPVGHPADVNQNSRVNVLRESGFDCPGGRCPSSPPAPPPAAHTCPPRVRRHARQRRCPGARRAAAARGVLLPRLVTPPLTPAREQQFLQRASPRCGQRRTAARKHARVTFINVSSSSSGCIDASTPRGRKRRSMAALLTTTRAVTHGSLLQRLAKRHPGCGAAAHVCDVSEAEDALQAHARLRGARAAGAHHRQRPARGAQRAGLGARGQLLQRRADGARDVPVTRVCAAQHASSLKQTPPPKHATRVSFASPHPLAYSAAERTSSSSSAAAAPALALALAPLSNRSASCAALIS